eukprot:gene3617-7197_t
MFAKLWVHIRGLHVITPQAYSRAILASLRCRKDPVLVEDLFSI